MYIIISCIILCILFIILIRRYKKKLDNNYKIKYDNQYNEYEIELNKKKEQLLSEYNVYYSQIQESKQLLNQSQEDQKAHIRDVLDLQEKLSRGKIEDKLQRYYEQELAKINAELQEKTKEQQDKLIQLNDELTKQKLIVDDYEKKTSALIEQWNRQDQIQQNLDFYRCQLSSPDLEDIDCLKTIAQKINNKEVVNRLIYDAYYKKPLMDMIGRVLSNTNPSGIYKITNIKTQRCYIGRSVNIKDRWQQHVKTSLNIGTIARSRIHDAIKEEGIQNFTFEVLEEVPRDQLGSREKYWIGYFHSNTSGYNQSLGG